MNHFEKQIHVTRLPDELVARIESIETAWAQGGLERPPQRKIAVFDLDNTLLDGDVGDAVFTQLKLDERHGPLTVDGRVIPLSWQEYQEILAREGKVPAYRRITAAMAGIPLDTLLETSRRVMENRLDYLDLEGERIPVPRQNPVMRELLALLTRLGYGLYIISASNQYTVRVVAEHYLGIPAAHSFGIVSELEHNGDGRAILTERLESPLPITDGKAEIYRDRIARDLPLVTGGDSDTDIHLLNLTHPDGVAIWRGDSGKKFQYIDNHLENPACLYTVHFQR